MDEIESPPLPPPDEGPEQRRERLLGVVERLPRGPGVYLFRNADGAVAYVGKARDLRERVRSYFQRSSGDTRRAVLFVERYVHTIEFVSTASEQDAFLLENKLVKRWKPAYNVKLRDDKDFLYVRVDRRHPFPALGLARRPRGRRKDISFHGPFASAGSLRHALRLLGGVIPLRDCSDREFASRTRPCLKHDMGRCVAPCVGLVTRDEYGRLLEQALDVLAGRCEDVLVGLQARMEAEAREQHYERAARLRDQIRSLRAIAAPPGVENTSLPDADVIGLHRAGSLAQLVILFFRGGALVSKTGHALDSELPDDELLEGFLLQFYGESRPVPREILLPCEPADGEGLTEFLAARRGGGVEVSAPSRGERRAAVELASRNAEQSLALEIEQRGQQHALLEALAKRLELPAAPETIECYDVSHTGRGVIVASRVAFRHGEPDSSRYRSYRIKSLDGPDDYGALREVLRRRFARAAQDPLPDLLVVDGGAGQLSSALRAAEDAGLASLPLAALAKGGRRGRALTLEAGERERVFRPGRPEPIELDRGSPEEYLLQRLRDEAHRFAIGAHRKARSREALASRLDDVPGVGPVLRRRLLTAFGGSQALARASVEELAGVRGVGERLARTIHEHLQSTGSV
jgi:excinuclease ABC subunit C